MRILTALLPLLLSFSAHAATVTGVSGASNYDITGTTAKVYGGIAPACSGALVACNDRPIADGSNVSIFISSEKTGNLIVSKTSDTTHADLGILQNTSNESAVLRWTDICLNSTAAQACSSITTSGTVTLRFWIDTDGSDSGTGEEDSVDVTFKVINPGAGFDEYGNPSTDGIGGFFPYPGDEKIYLDQLAIIPSSTFPTLTYGSVVEFVRVYYATNMDRAMPTEALDFADLEVNDEGDGLVDDMISGLENGTVYAFRIAMVDEAMNIVQFFPDAATALAENCDTELVFGHSCPWASTPDEVIGMLSDDFNCFVASAAYGTSLEPKLKIFREFRHRVLLTREWGKKFVTWYYKTGPYAARFIDDKPLLRGLTRAALWPLYGFSLLAIKFGLWPALLLFSLITTALILLPLYGVKRWSARA